MLFNSYSFIFLFLPFAYFGFVLLRKRYSLRIISLWLLGMSLFFYTYWSPNDLIILICSIVINYFIFILMRNNYENENKARLFLKLGVILNIFFLVFYKYFDFITVDILGIVNEKTNQPIPLGISFFTFTQIAFLVDCFKNRYVKNDFINYSLFVSYFPHLVCGPIILFKNIYPQLTNKDKFDTSISNVISFFFVFSIGLFKKCCIADSLGTYSVQLFDASANTFFNASTAFLGVSGYALQLYFDFSGYSDMAVAISSLFGINIPYNFNSPYQATSIIEFWRRWHISLSSFLRDYVYIPLGGNRGSLFMRYKNLLLTMGIGGIWHGPSWTFLIWGLYHGVLLILNHEFRRFKTDTQSSGNQLIRIGHMFMVFCLVSLGWVLFRSPTLEYAMNIYKSLLGLYNKEGQIIRFSASLFIPLVIAFALPDTLSLKEHFERDIRTLQRNKVILWSLFCSVIFSLSLLRLNKVQYFLYSQF